MQGKKKARNKNQCSMAVWLPAELLKELDKEVAARDTDRSKLIRLLLRKELKLAGNKSK